MCTSNLLDYVADELKANDRGVKRLGRNLLAFSKGGSVELARFAKWLKGYGYVQEAFSASDIEFSTWALLLSHPLGTPNGETVEFGLWEAAAATGRPQKAAPARVPTGFHEPAHVKPVLCPW
jgi:hypothetical protein